MASLSGASSFPEVPPETERISRVNPRPLHVRSFAKVNLALSVLGRRPDGFHEIRTVLQSIDLCDELEFWPCRELRLECHGAELLRNEDNLVWRAARALAKRVSAAEGAEIVLRKRIPLGSGLGGGSSNAAATLLGLARFWNLRVPAAELQNLACELGSDAPFFLCGGTALGTGRGEEIYPLAELPPVFLVVVYPGIPVSTAAAYGSLSLTLTSPGSANKIASFCERTQEGAGCLTGIFNDFETSILPAYPAIRQAKILLEERGAVATLLSGSGSSVFGFFKDEESALAASRGSVRETWRVFPAKTLSRAEYFQRMFG